MKPEHTETNVKTETRLVAYSTVGQTPVFGQRTDRPALGLQPTGDHYMGKPSATGQPTRPTQPFILPRSIN